MQVKTGWGGLFYRTAPGLVFIDMNPFSPGFARKNAHPGVKPGWAK